MQLWSLHIHISQAVGERGFARSEGVLPKTWAAKPRSTQGSKTQKASRAPARIQLHAALFDHEVLVSKPNVKTTGHRARRMVSRVASPGKHPGPTDSRKLIGEEQQGCGGK